MVSSILSRIASRTMRSTMSFKSIVALLLAVVSYSALEPWNGFESSLVAHAQERDKKKAKEEPPRPLPDDQRLLALHLDFVKKAEKLGNEYEGDKDWGKARQVYEEILKLVPQYAPAKSKLAEMLNKEASAQTHVVTINANEGWQDCGLTLIYGRPVTITVSGTWTFHLQAETNADGLAIPEELRDFNPGCLIGRIEGGDPKEVKPFVVGAGKQFQTPRSGRLSLRMYDTNPADNDGSLKVEIRGSFELDKDVKKPTK